MKKIILIIAILLSTVGFVNSVECNIDLEKTINIWNMEQRQNLKKDIREYTKDVGVKYKYSSRAKEFLTQKNLNLIIDNCESFPSVIIAMAIIETGWGKYAIGNNYFGIKGRGHVRRTKEWDGNKFITVTSSFQQYMSKEDNIRAVSNLLHNNNRYGIGVANSYSEAANIVKSGGYATDPLYASKIKFIIKKYELNRLDEIKSKYKPVIINEKNMFIAIDFDGTCVSHEFPKVGKDIGASKVLKKLIKNGDKLILYTMRANVKDVPSPEFEGTFSGNYLDDAVKWFKDNDIELYGVQTNPTQKEWTSSPKCYANLYIDDCALGVPLIYDKKISERPFVDWFKVDKMIFYNNE